jgi:hypothetical protein
MVIGFLSQILFGIPMTLSRQILSRLMDEIDRERLVTEESIKERLQQLQLMLQDGEINEAEYDGLETQLIERLKAVREYQRSKGAE